MVHRELEKNLIRKAGIIHYILVFFGVYKKINVSGHSMWPILYDGQTIFYKKAVYEAGDIVVAEHPYRKKLVVKQIESISGDGVRVKALNAVEGEDSRLFGVIQLENIMGKVYKKI